jgi:Flp pilus assembly protein TadD
MSSAAKQAPDTPQDEHPTPPPPVPDRRAWVLIGVPVLAALVAFAPVVANGFVDWDDRENFLENSNYTGLGWPQIRWAWSAVLLGVFQPLSWMLLEVQYTLWGLAPWGYHLSSLALYLAATAALYALVVALLERGGAVAAGRGSWRIHLGAAVAVTLFAIHPLRTEVVAWVSSQSYLPCALFSLLTLLAYLRAHPVDGPMRLGWAATAFLLFVAALLSKAVAVTVPCVLLILDVYPLRRIGGREGLFAGPKARQAWLEKLPYFAEGVVFAGVAVWARRQDFVSHRGEPLALGPLETRVARTCYAVVFYLWKTIWPVRICAFYPLDQRGSLSAWPHLACGLLVGGTTAALVLLWKRWPALLAAWASYLVILAPNSGLVPGGSQAATDRYGYMAMMGLVVPVAGGIAGGLNARRRALALATIAAPMSIGLIALDWRQCRTWRDTLSLWGSALAFYPSSRAHTGLGAELLNQHRYAEAEHHLAEAVRMAPGDALARRRLANALAMQGKHAEAQAQLDALVENLAGVDRLMAEGISMSLRGKYAEAETRLAEVVRQQPEHCEARRALGVVLANQGRLSEAEAQFIEAVRLRPNHEMSRIDLGTSLAQQGKLAESEAQFAEAVRLNPESIAAMRNLGKVLGIQGRFAEAEAQFANVLRRQPDDRESQEALAEFRRIRQRIALP